MPICSGASLSIPQHPRCSKRPQRDHRERRHFCLREARWGVTPLGALGDMKDTDGINWDQMAKKKHQKNIRNQKKKTRINQIWWGLNHWFWRCLRLKMLKQARYMKKSMNIELQLACPYRAGLGRVAPSRTSMWQKALHLLHQLPSWQLQPTVTQLDGFSWQDWSETCCTLIEGGITISSGVSWSSGGELQQRHQCMQQERSMAVGTANSWWLPKMPLWLPLRPPLTACQAWVERVRRFLHILVASHDADDSTEMTWNDIMTSCWSCGSCDSCVDIRIGRSLAPGCGFVCCGFVCCGFVCCGCGWWCVVRRRLRQLGSGSRRSLSSRRWRDQRLLCIAAAMETCEKGTLAPMGSEVDWLYHKNRMYCAGISCVLWLYATLC